MERWRVLINRVITKEPVKNEHIKRKQACSLCFVNVFKFQENKFKITQKNFEEISIMLIRKTFLGKLTSCNDHCMNNLGSQSPKIGGN